jgi:tRNA(Met) cytidine acetyltransferase
MKESEIIGNPGPRRLVLVPGDPAWGEGWVTAQLAACDLASVLWVADSAPAGIVATPAHKVSQCLGGESRLLVFNAHHGFHPDAFAAAVGTLRGGGDCVILMPPIAGWPAYADPDKARFASYPRSPGDMRGLFLERLLRLWCAHSGVRIVSSGSRTEMRVADPAPVGLQLSEAQEEAVAAVQRVALGHARRPLVLSADRGRGKSTVLGVAAARLLLDDYPRITVVAPRRAAVATLFMHALNGAGLSGHEIGDTLIGAGRLCFRLPSECMAAADEELGLIMVDEAAAIPVAVLGSLLERTNRLVFASTLYGYEGSGRGFELRFKSLLQQQMPQWRGLRLSAPVRWAADDPLEALIDGSLLLDADLVRLDPAAGYTIERMESSQLAKSEDLLRSAFGLLINAHYQTRPSDLRQLLDNPDVYIWLARAGDAVVGVLLALAEGGFDEAMAGHVLRGTRRPRGHLLPQSLAVHAGLDQVLLQRLLRVQRIAVHPQLQRRGIGRSLLEITADWATGGRFDALGCAYGVDPPLLGFWQSVGFEAVRTGVRVDPASAAHSLFMLRGLSGPGRELAAVAGQHFRAQLPWALAGSLSDLDSRLAVQLLGGRDCSDLALSANDRRDLGRIATGARQVATAEALVWRALVVVAAQGPVDVDRLAPLIAWQLQRRAIGWVCQTFSMTGRRTLEKHLQSLFSDYTGCR